LASRIFSRRNISARKVLTRIRRLIRFPAD
jgi:hypothetical protein